MGRRLGHLQSPIPLSIELKLIFPFYIQMGSQFRKIRFVFSGEKTGQAVQLPYGE